MYIFSCKTVFKHLQKNFLKKYQIGIDLLYQEWYRIKHKPLKGGITVLSICCLTAILTVAAYEDITDFRVSNRLIISGYLLGLLYRMINYGVVGGLTEFVKGVILPVVILYILFVFRMLGAGDIKLISVIGGFCGTGFSLRVFVAALFAGSILSIVRCIQHGYLWNRLEYFREYVTDFIINKQVKAYYLRERDGDSVVIPFSVSIGIGYAVIVFIFGINGG